MKGYKNIGKRINTECGYIELRHHGAEFSKDGYTLTIYWSELDNKPDNSVIDEYRVWGNSKREIDEKVGALKQELCSKVKEFFGGV